MAEHIHYEEEREKIDRYITGGFTITAITDHLNGSDVQFINDQHDQHTLTIGNANARKYASTLFFHKGEK